MHCWTLQWSEHSVAFGKCHEQHGTARTSDLVKGAEAREGDPIPRLGVLGSDLTSELWNTGLGFAPVFVCVFVFFVPSRSPYLHL